MNSITGDIAITSLLLHYQTQSGANKFLDKSKEEIRQITKKHGTSCSVSIKQSMINTLSRTNVSFYVTHTVLAMVLVPN